MQHISPCSLLIILIKVALLLVQAGADTRLMDSEERTADMVSPSQSEEALSDSSDQSEEL